MYTVRRRLVSGGCNVVVAVMLESRLRVLFISGMLFRRVCECGRWGGGEKLAVHKSCSKSVGWWFSSAGGGGRVVQSCCQGGGAEEGARGFFRGTDA